ncbi:hypothetical protein AVEN_189133-1 [Araneus ventricosus]|uniref:Uncharacterized protein n=1 Tax=Araneus ventricosus TaxID=182803 RepID=A0A4Y2I8N9_ARAVE|nr:hypothetical protein AVEN_189133-1 [Araneus ventricosus]
MFINNKDPIVKSKTRGSLMTRSRLRSRRARGLKPVSTDDSLCMWSRCMLNLESWVKRPLPGVSQKLGKGVPAQEPSSLSVYGSNLRGPSQNRSRLLNGTSK